MSDAHRISEALGASRSIALDGLPSAGPLDLLQLQRQVAALRETPAVECRLQVSAERWRELVQLADELGAEGEEVSPTLLARALLELGVAALLESRDRTA